MKSYKVKTLKTLIFVILSLTSINSIYSQDKKADLEVTTQPSSQVVRGGETFSYISTIRNIGDAKAVDVVAIHQAESVTSFISHSSSKGVCKNHGEPIYVKKIHCELGDLEIGETVIILFEINVHEFGDVSAEAQEKERKYAKSLMRRMGRTTSKKPVSRKRSVGNVEVFPRQNDKNIENNSAKVLIELLPSKNIPPRLQILFPKEDKPIVLNNNQPFELTVRVKAFDPDGEIKRVFLKNLPKFTIERDSSNRRQIFYFIVGGKVNGKDVRKNYEEYRKYFETELTKVGKDLYEIKLKDLKYGVNQITIEAEDNGGRGVWRRKNFNIIGDSKIEIISPQKDTAFTPGSTVIIRTKSQVNDSSANQFKITGMDGNIGFSDLDSMRNLTLIKRTRNTLEHQYMWKNVPAGLYSLEAILKNKKGVETNASERVMIAVVEPNTVKIVSIKDGQEFKEYEKIKINVKVTDKNGKPLQGNLELFINGKSKDEINSGNLLPYLTKGKHTIQVASNTREYGFLKGKSKPITITIK